VRLFLTPNSLQICFSIFSHLPDGTLTDNVRVVARLARVVAVDIAHHVTQRGNARRFILDCDANRMVYLNLLWENIELHKVSLVGYCPMSNHIHLVGVPRKDDGLALALKHTHGRYATYWNAVYSSSGHVWQGRYYSCPLDQPHLWEALRYTELNPVRAGLVTEAESWTWSSAAAHCGRLAAGECLAMEMWRGHWNASTWRKYLAVGKWNQSLPPFVGVRTRVDRLGRKSSSMLSRKRRSGAWSHKKAAAQKKQLQIEASATSRLTHNRLSFGPCRSSCRGSGERPVWKM
jgi:putative transposase